MSLIDTTGSTQTPLAAEQEQELCTYCGKPLYECSCPDRWENEGGATLPRKDDAA